MSLVNRYLVACGWWIHSRFSNINVFRLYNEKFLFFILVSTSLCLDLYSFCSNVFLHDLQLNYCQFVNVSFVKRKDLLAYVYTALFSFWVKNWKKNILEVRFLMQHLFWLIGDDKFQILTFRFRSRKDWGSKGAKETRFFSSPTF